MIHYDLEWLTNKYDNDEILNFIYFWGHSGEKIGKNCLSQWYNIPFTVKNIKYKTAEHWMMAQKALLFNDDETFNKILNVGHPSEVKQMGREIKNFNGKIWDKAKFEIVKKGNIYKFEQNPKLKDYLLQTGNNILVEASPFDTIWGIGMSQDDVHIDDIYKWRGENLLGFALMEVRDLLK